MLKTFRRISLLCCLLLTIGHVSAQISTTDNNTAKDNSPYSRLGLGDFTSPYYAGALGMGGLGAAFNDPFQTNMVNPASLSFLRTTSYEVGLFAQYASLNSPSNDPIGVWSGNLQYISLSFPMRNPINEVLDQKKRDVHWGMGISLQPYTTVGYTLISETAITEDNTSVITAFNGRGGTYKFQWANSVKYKDLSVGVSLGYLFGKIINERDVAFQDSDAGFNNEFLDELSINGVVWNFGVMYKYSFKKPNKKGELANTGKSFTIGAYGSSDNTISTNSSQLYRRFSRNFGVIDTLSAFTEVEGEVTLPATFGIGVMYEDFNKIRVGFDFSASQWSNYRNDAKPESFDNTSRTAFGIEYIPDVNSYNNYAKRMRYRFGGYYETDPRNINEQLTNYGITLGLGLPVILRNKTSFVNLSVEAGKFGTDTSFNENYIKATLGFTLNDNTWFFKRKFE